MKTVDRKHFRQARHARLRRKIAGDAARPRLALMISNRHIHVQFVDDAQGRTLASLSTAGRAEFVKLNVASAQAIGKEVAALAAGKGIREVVVDRGGFRYHGRVRALVEAAVAAGLRVERKKEAT